MTHYAIQHKEFALNQLTAIRCAIKAIKRNLNKGEPIVVSQSSLMISMKIIQKRGSCLEKLFIHAVMVSEREFDILLHHGIKKMYQQYRQIQVKIGSLAPNEHHNLMISLTKIGFRIISLAEKVHKSNSLRV